MRTWIGFSCAGLLCGLLVACGDDDGNGGGSDLPAQQDVSQGTDNAGTDNTGSGPVVLQGAVELNDGISQDTLVKAGSRVSLKKHIFVENATLTIEPGVTFLGEQGSSLVITPSARIQAEGTAETPIVFTSARPAGRRAPGDWGGVVLLGRAPINVAGGSEKVEGFPATEGRSQYGGDDSQHNCGTLRYARIEFAGYELAKDNELNGLTIGGCGRGTVIDFVQIHKGADDGIEMFGGTADLRHIVITQMDDDGLDWDFGWSGRVQFLVVQQNGVVGDKGFEADSNKNDNNAAPRSKPQIWNFSLIGSNSAPGTAGKNQKGIHFRRGTAGHLFNGILAYFTDGGILVDDSATVTQAQDGELFLKHSLFWDNKDDTTGLPVESGVEGFDGAAFFLAAALQNRVVDPQLTRPLDLASPSFVPKAGSPALSGGATPPNDGFFDTAATFIGAVGATDWMAGWTAFPEN